MAREGLFVVVVVHCSIISGMLGNMNHKRLFAETAGWYGTGAIVLAYLLVSFNVISADSATYQLLNLTGALGIVAIAVAKKVTQSIVLNLFWAAIALIALIRLAIS